MLTLVHDDDLGFYRELGISFLEGTEIEGLETNDKILKTFEKIFQNNLPKKGWKQEDILYVCLGVYIQGRK